MKAFIGNIKGRGGRDELEMGKLGWSSDLTNVLLLDGKTDSYFAKAALGENVSSDGGKAALAGELALPTSASRVPGLGVLDSRGMSTISLSTSSLEMNGLVAPSLIRRFHSLSLTCTGLRSFQDKEDFEK